MALAASVETGNARRDGSCPRQQRPLRHRYGSPGAGTHCGANRALV